jgi:hypothetical protein
MKRPARFGLSVLGVTIALLALSATPAMAHEITTATVTATCTGYSITVNGVDFVSSDLPGYVTYEIDGFPGGAITGSIPINSVDSSGDISVTASGSVASFTGTATLSGSATLFDDSNTQQNTITFTPSTFSPTNSFSCGSAPPPPPPCVGTATNSSNFNGTSVPAGSYIWFNANFKANHVPSGGVTIDFTNGNVSFTAGGTSYSLAVPNAKITFSPGVSCTSTTFDSGSDTWITTVPVSGDDEVFLTGFAWPVPSGGLHGGANPVNFSGTYSSETNAPGLSIEMKWSAAAYSSFTTDYNALQIKAGHQTACGQNNGDHAGTPEGVDSTNTPWKKYLVGGPRGGGGSNFTGSWSGTLNINICP